MAPSSSSTKKAAAVRKKTSSTAPPPRIDLSNPNGFSPELWGPSMWFMVHLVAATYPVAPTATDKAQAMAFYKSLQWLLPCMGCRLGYRAIVGSDPTKLTSRVFASRQSLFKWTVDVHNRVNAKLKKPQNSDWQAWYREYDGLR